MYITYFNLHSRRNEIPYPLTYFHLTEVALQVTATTECTAVPYGPTINVPKPDIRANVVVLTRSNQLDHDGTMDQPVFYWVERTTETWLECSLWGTATAVSAAYNDAEIAWNRITPPQSRYFRTYDDALLSTSQRATEEAFHYHGAACIVVTMTNFPVSGDVWTATDDTTLSSFDFRPMTAVIISSGGLIADGSTAREYLEQLCKYLTSTDSWKYVKRIQVLPKELVERGKLGTIYRFGSSTIPAEELEFRLQEVLECGTVSCGAVSGVSFGGEYPAVTRHSTTAKLYNYGNKVAEFNLRDYRSPEVFLRASLVDGVNPYILVAETDVEEYEAESIRAAVVFPEIMGYGENYTAWYNTNKAALEAQETSAAVGVGLSIAALAGATVTAIVAPPVSLAMGLATVAGSAYGVYTASANYNNTMQAQQMSKEQAKRNVLSAGTTGYAYANDKFTPPILCTLDAPSPGEVTLNEKIIRRRGASAVGIGSVDLTGFKYRVYEGSLCQIRASELVCVTEDELIASANTELSSGVVFYSTSVDYTTSPYTV